jgi:hypothetical protein
VSLTCVSLTCVSLTCDEGAEDRIRTRDPHLGKVRDLVDGVLASRLARSSVHSVSSPSTRSVPAVDRSTIGLTCPRMSERRSKSPIRWSARPVPTPCKGSWTCLPRLGRKNPLNCPGRTSKTRSSTPKMHSCSASGVLWPRTRLRFMPKFVGLGSGDHFVVCCGTSFCIPRLSVSGEVCRLICGSLVCEFHSSPSFWLSGTIRLGQILLAESNNCSNTDTRSVDQMTLGTARVEGIARRVPLAVG